MAILDERLNLRVDKMVSRGLVDEVVSFGSRQSPDLGHGIWQSIGLKEFIPYLDYLNHSRTLGGSEEKASAILSTCIEDLKLHTRQYARNQSTWVRNRFWKKGHQPTYVLNTDNLNDSQNWNLRVIDPASALVKAFLKNSPIVASGTQSSSLSPYRMLRQLSSYFEHGEMSPSQN